MKAATSPNKEYYLPNKMGRIFMLSHEEMLGKNGLTALLKIAGLSGWIGELPENNYERGFSFTTTAKICEALGRLYGPNAGSGLALRSGHAAFKYGLQEFAPLLGLSELNFRLLPLQMKIEKAMEALTSLYADYSDQIVRLERTEDAFLWHIDRCPYCWGLHSSSPCCSHVVGIFQEAMHWISGGKYFDVEETSCTAAGDRACTITIHMP